MRKQIDAPFINTSSSTSVTPLETFSQSIVDQNIMFWHVIDCVMGYFVDFADILFEDANNCSN